MAIKRQGNPQRDYEHFGGDALKGGLKGRAVSVADLATFLLD